MCAVYPRVPLENCDRVFVSLVGNEICLHLVFVMTYIGRGLATADRLSKDPNQISVNKLHRPEKQEALKRIGL